ncbi:hypothetical protein D3C87_1319920 [compost metagenome]
MLRVALGKAGQAQAQLIVLGSKLYRAVAQRVVGGAVVGFFEFDLDAFGAQRGRADAGQLLQPARDDRIHHEAVIAVVRADGVKTQPGPLGVFVKARLTAIVGAIQGFEANQAARRFAHSRRLCRGDTGQTGLAQAAELTHP